MTRTLVAVAAILVMVMLTGCIGNDPDPAVKANYASRMVVLGTLVLMVGGSVPTRQVMQSATMGA